LNNTVFSYIPNTAEVAFLGMVEELTRYCDEEKQKLILREGKNITPRTSR
jgi:amidophosphoribosyltransferase